MNFWYLFQAVAENLDFNDCFLSLVDNNKVKLKVCLIAIFLFGGELILLTMLI